MLECRNWSELIYVGLHCSCNDYTGINSIYDETAHLDTRGSCNCSYNYLQDKHPEVISVQCRCLLLHYYYGQQSDSRRQNPYKKISYTYV